MLEKFFGPRCQHCGQRKKDGHHCAEMERKGKEISDELEREVTVILKKQKEREARGSIFSNEDGKICLDRDPKAQ